MPRLADLVESASCVERNHMTPEENIFEAVELPSEIARRELNYANVSDF